MQKTQKIKHDGDEDEDSVEMSVSDSDEDEDNQGLKAKMVEQMRDQVESSEEDENESGSDDDSDAENSGNESSDGSTINMKFDEKTKQLQKKKEQKTAKGIMGLKFMERAQQKEKEALKAQVNLAVKQINGEDDYAGSDGDGDSSDENEKFLDASKKFGVKALTQS